MVPELADGIGVREAREGERKAAAEGLGIIR